MKLTHLFIATAVLVAPAVSADIKAEFAKEFESCVAPDATVTRLATGMKFIEGPVWLPQTGQLVFSDIPANELKSWTPGKGVETYRSPSQNANGNTLDRQGRLITCEHSGRRVAVVSEDGTLRTLTDRHDGKRFNSPNDVVVSRDGAVWFTDPEYGLATDPKTKKKVGKEQSGNHVYRHDPRTGKVTLAAQGFDQPNGLAFSPDEMKLYVADSGAPRNIRVFAVASDGTLSDDKVFCTLEQGVPDGIRVDTEGRVWSTAADGVHVFDRNGRRLGKILTPESPANLCFGGKNGTTLFITARTSLYSIEVKVKGAAP
jgi:gluconolactonase